MKKLLIPFIFLAALGGLIWWRLKNNPKSLNPALPVPATTPPTLLDLSNVITIPDNINAQLGPDVLNDVPSPLFTKFQTPIDEPGYHYVHPLDLANEIFPTPLTVLS